MIEARIECMCHTYTVPDLGLALVSGQVMWLPEDKARASADLRHAKNIGAVSVQYRARCQVARPTLPVWIGNKRKIGFPPDGPPVREVPTPAPEPVILSPEEILRKATEEMRKIVRDEMSGRSAETAPQNAPDLSKVMDELRQIVRDEIRSGVVLAPTQVNAADRGEGVASDEPVFIPSDLGTAQVTQIDVAATNTDAGDTASAAEALKAAKRTRRNPKN